jgi:hypothetical protein
VIKNNDGAASEDSELKEVSPLSPMDSKGKAKLISDDEEAMA